MAFGFGFSLTRFLTIYSLDDYILLTKILNAARPRHDVQGLNMVKNNILKAVVLLFLFNFACLYFYPDPANDYKLLYWLLDSVAKVT
jgi:hypothetical protein